MGPEKHLHVTRISRHPAETSPSRPGRSFVVLGAAVALSLLVVLPGLALADAVETPVTEAISGQYHDGSAIAAAPQMAEVGDVAAGTATAVADAAAPVSQAPAPPEAVPAAAPATSSESSNNNAGDDMQSVPVTTAADVVSHVVNSPPEESESSQAVALEATDATVPAAGPASAYLPQGGAPAPAASATPDAQAAGAAPTGDATAAAQTTPSNVNVSVRIFSPGNDGPVTQTNVAGAETVSVATTTTTTQDGASLGGGANPAPAVPGLAAPATWVWNWTWESTAAGCAPGAAPATPSSTVADSTWTWTWIWRCAPRVPVFDTPIIPLIPDMPPIAAIVPGAGAWDDAFAAGPSRAQGAGAPTPRPATRRPLATREPSDDFRKVWATLGSSSTGRGRGGADSGADTAPAAARVADSPITALFRSGLTASVAAAAAAGAGGSGPGGIGLGAAALFAAFVLLAPQVLIPLKAAAARRLPDVSARRDRPG